MELGESISDLRNNKLFSFKILRKHSIKIAIANEYTQNIDSNILAYSKMALKQNVKKRALHMIKSFA